MTNAHLPHSSEPVLDGKNNFSWPWIRYFEQLKARIGADKHYDLGGTLHVDVPIPRYKEFIYIVSCAAFIFPNLSC